MNTLVVSKKVHHSLLEAVEMGVQKASFDVHPWMSAMTEISTNSETQILLAKLEVLDTLGHAHYIFKHSHLT